jgi:hypothetical protein
MAPIIGAVLHLSADSMTLLVAGMLAGRILFASPDAKLVRTIEIPVPFATNRKFAPDGAVTLCITACFDPWKAPYPGVVYWRSRWGIF